MNEPSEPWQTAPKPRRQLPIFLVAAVLIAALVGLLNWRFPYALEGQDGLAHLIYLLIFLVFIGGGAFHQGIKARQIVQYAAIWIGIAGVAGLGYAYRFELAVIKDRIVGELVPGAGIQISGGEIQFRSDSSGHFTVEALVNGFPVRFLVDTGASDVVLSPGDATRIGYNLKQLEYSRRYQTANGVVMGAPIRLASVRIGPIDIPNVAGSINGAPLNSSLLGMSFLERLTSYSVKNGTLILRQ
jgi:aspartyl protease family protein